MHRPYPGVDQQTVLFEQFECCSIGLSWDYTVGWPWVDNPGTVLVVTKHSTGELKKNASN